MNIDNRPSFSPNWTVSPRPFDTWAYIRTFDYPRGYVGNLHSHREAQFVYPVRGVASVTTTRGHWLASPMRGTAIPAWEPHRIDASGNTLLYSLFVDPRSGVGAFASLRMVDVTPLLHELIREAGRYFVDYGPGSVADRMLGLIVELIARQQTGTGGWLPVIGNERIRRAVEASGPADLRVTAVAERAAYSVRQFSRLFLADTGMAFKDWRALYRVQAGAGLLAGGGSVTEVAATLGFSSASAFISVFRQHMGVTPTALHRSRTC